MSQKEKYLQEYEKYKNIIRKESEEYLHKDTSVIYKILKINRESETVDILSTKNSYTTTKTLHWCRKYLKEIKTKGEKND